MSKSESDSDSEKKYEEEENDIEENDLVDDEEVVVNDEEEIESLVEEEDWYRHSDFYPIFYLRSYLHLNRKPTHGNLTPTNNALNACAIACSLSLGLAVTKGYHLISRKWTDKML